MKSGQSWRGRLAPSVALNLGRPVPPEGYLEWCCLLDGQTDFLSLIFFL